MTALHGTTIIEQEPQMVHPMGATVGIALLLQENVAHHLSEGHVPFAMIDDDLGVRHTQAEEEAAIEGGQDPRLPGNTHHDGTPVQGHHRVVHDGIRDRLYEPDLLHHPVGTLLPTIVALAHLHHQCAVILHEKE